MPTMTATDARREFFEVIKNTRQTHDVYHIQHRLGNVVMLSEKDYESMVETLQLLSVPGFREELRESMQEMASGETVSFQNVFGSDN